MATSRDANDPRDRMKAMRREEQQEFERKEASDTGGVEHQGPGEGEAGGPAPEPKARPRSPGRKP